MTRIDLGGVYGAATVSANRDGQTATVHGNIPRPAGDAAIASYVLHETVERVAEPISITGTVNWNGHGWGHGYGPGVLADQRIIQAVNGDRIVLPDLGLFSSYTPEMYSGGEIEIRRITDGEMKRIGGAKVTAARFPMSDLVSGNRAAVTGTSYVHKFEGYNRHNVPYWFTVAAVAADGSIGTKAAWISFVPTSGGTGTVANATVAVPSDPGTAAALAAPGGLKAVQGTSGFATLTWQAVAGAAGYRIWIAYNDPATWPANVGELQITGATGTPKVGDMVIWRREILALQGDMISNRVFGSEGSRSGLVPPMVQAGHYNLPTDEVGYEIRPWATGEKPSSDLGNYYMRRKIKAGGRMADGVAWASHSSQTYYHFKEPGQVLCVDVWIRASREGVVLNFSSGLPGEPKQSVTLGTTWKRYHFESDYTRTRAQYASGAVSSWFFEALAGTAALDVEFAQVQPYLKGVPYGRMGAQIEQGLVPGSKLRDHLLIKSYPKTYTAKTAFSPAGEGWGGWTCDMHFDLCRDCGLIPWVQLEWALFKEDWLAWMDWLVLRHHDFETIMLEIGNENWNPTNGFWFMPFMQDSSDGTTLGNGPVYGMMSTMIMDWLRESPHWATLGPKIELVIGGHIGSDFGSQAYRYCPEAKYVTVAQYNGGWDAGTDLAAEDGATYQGMLRFLGGVTALKRHETSIGQVADLLDRVVGTDVFHDIYEAGPGYQVNGLNGVAVTRQNAIDQEAVQKSRVSAASQLDAICISWSREWVSNFFMLGRGDGWRTHNDSSEEYLTHTVGRVISEFLGEFRVHQLYPLVTRQTDGIEDVGLYAFQSVQKPDRWLYIAVNRVIDRSVLAVNDPMYDPEDTGLRAVTFHTHLSKAASCRAFLGGIGNMRHHNRWAPGQRMTIDAQWTSDPTCVSFDIDWHDKVVPADPGAIVIDAALGAEPGGLRGGNFIMIALSGAE